MNLFKIYYLKACDNYKINPYETVLSKIEESRNSSTLNLSPLELNDDTCKAIGQAFKKDDSIKELNLSNCILTDRGLSRILLGLEINKFLLSLNLTGNRITAIRTICVAEFLRRNTHLQNLDLELNQIGTCFESFSDLCESLCVNTSLKSLDLRNNELDYFCAKPIARFLKRNYTLQKLDLRWNSIGVFGGRIILRSLAKRKLNQPSNENDDAPCLGASRPRLSYAEALNRLTIKECSPTEIELQSIVNLKNEIEREKEEKRKLEERKTELDQLEQELRDTLAEAEKERDKLLAEKQILVEMKQELISNSNEDTSQSSGAHSKTHSRKKRAL